MDQQHEDGEGRGLLGDTAARDYSRKLRLFNAFAAPELREAIGSLDLKPGMRILDAGCGTGEALAWFREWIGPTGMTVGIDLARAHTAAAREMAQNADLIAQADLLSAPVREGSVDLVWAVNTINHLRDPLAGVKALKALLAPMGRIAIGQSSLLADMCFAWDARLERLTNEAVRRYYEDRYAVDEGDLAGIRSIVGLLRRAEFRNVTSRTFTIERIVPLKPADEEYLLEAIFRNTWGERLRPYLMREHYEQLSRLCDPGHAEFALRRPDFHFIQTFTLVVGWV